MSWNPVTSLILKKGNAIVNFAKKKKKKIKCAAKNTHESKMCFANNSEFVSLPK